MGKRLLRDERGSAYLEILIALPILVLLIFGGMSIAKLAGTYINLLQVEHQVLKQEAIAGYFDVKAQSMLMTSLASMGISQNQVAVSATTVREPYGNPVTLSLSMPYRISLFGQNTPIAVTVHVNETALSSYVPAP